MTKESPEELEGKRDAPGVEGVLSQWLESWRDQVAPEVGRDAPTLEPGQMVGRYRVERVLGKGGMGQVYLAQDTELERPVALKFLLADPGEAPDRRRRLLREARSASALNHPNVCTVFEVGEVSVDADRPGLAYIAMEYLDGTGLDEILRAGSTPIQRVLEIATEVCDALDAAHSKGVIHRDIKPANICLSERGHVKVVDFGLAKRIGAPSDAALDSSDFRATKPGAVGGTPLYMSPEQALATTDVDHRSDIFSFGVVLYEMVTGQLPFRGSTSADVLDKIVHAQPEAMARFNYESPAELDRITRKCLEKAPDERYQSARELLIDLRKLLGDVTGGASPARSSETDAAPAASSGATTPPAPLTEAPDPATVGESDVLISYAPVDDQPLLEGQSGWVSRLHRNLAVRVEQLSGEKVKIARLPGAPKSTAAEAEILERLPEAKAMVAVVSPPFVKTEACRTEVEHFWRLAEQTGGQWVEDKARLLKVLKTAVSSREFPSALADIFSPLLGFEFFERESATGRVREFDEIFGVQPKQRFFERVYDLAHDLCHILRGLRQLDAQERAHPDADTHRRWIYLAAATSDVQDERDRIKRELVERGHVVLPDAPLPMMSGDAEDVVRDQLEKCSIAVHLLGRNYGVTPEDSSESLPALQLRLTALCAQDQELERLIWIPENGGAADERQREFIRRVEEDPGLHERAEIIEGNLNLLKKDLIRRLRPPEEPKKLEAPASRVTPKLYLICAPRDEEAIEPLEDYLFGQGLEICLPAFDGSDAEAEALHRENLLTCDAVLIYYGTAPRAWVDIKLRELLKAAGYGREAPIGPQAVYVAPPDDRRKARFQSHQARVIRQEREFASGAELEEFVGEAKASGS